MQQELYIQGMTCQSCRMGIIEKISTLSAVSSVEVSLETGKAVLEAENQIPLEQIKELLGTKYTVSSAVAESLTHNSQNSKLKDLFPLFLIFGYLIIATFYLNFLIGGSLNDALRHFMGLFFITFSFFKFLDYKGFPSSFARYDPLAKKSLFYAKIYPFIEAVLGVAFILSWQLPFALFFTLVILSITTYGVMQSILNKSTIQCACLGTALKLPMTEATLIENGIMIVMSCIMLLEYIL